MVRTQISLPDDLYHRLEREALRQAVIVDELFRRAVERVAAEALVETRHETNPWLRFAGVERPEPPKPALPATSGPTP